MHERAVELVFIPASKVRSEGETGAQEQLREDTCASTALSVEAVVRFRRSTAGATVGLVLELRSAILPWEDNGGKSP